MVLTLNQYKCKKDQSEKVFNHLVLALQSRNKHQNLYLTMMVKTKDSQTKNKKMKK